MAPRIGVVGAISTREGFTDDAWKERVLLVRGSLEEPEVLVVNVKAVLKGQETDIQLQPGDIIYVADRPWYKAEEILDQAMIAFIQSSTSTWITENVPALIDDPFLGRTGWTDEDDVEINPLDEQ